MYFFLQKKIPSIEVHHFNFCSVNWHDSGRSILKSGIFHIQTFRGFSRRNRGNGSLSSDIYDGSNNEREECSVERLHIIGLEYVAARWPLKRWRLGREVLNNNFSESTLFMLNRFCALKLTSIYPLVMPQASSVGLSYIYNIFVTDHRSCMIEPAFFVWTFWYGGRAQ